jgi:CheY-like chemotaxis protein/HPt (histidine-containing phosphotransfer) domain-containing protein
VVSLFLEKLGYSADVVANGLEAVQAVARQAYDVVLMDVQMPEMDGFEATRIIREQHRPGPRIVAVTANALAGDEQRCRASGMDDYITKPIDLLELRAALQRVGTDTSALTSTPAASAPPPRAVPPSPHWSGDFRPELLGALEQTFTNQGAREIIEALAMDLPAQMTELTAGLGKGDRTSVRRVIHTLKSNCLLLGAQELGKLCEHTERGLRESLGDDPSPAIRQVAHRYPILVSAWRGLLG